MKDFKISLRLKEYHILRDLFTSELFIPPTKQIKASFYIYIYIYIYFLL